MGLAQFRREPAPALRVQFPGVDDDAVPVEYRAKGRLHLSIADF